MQAAHAEIVGRERELHALEAFLGSNAQSASALVLDGDAGIGKTTLWEDGIRAGREQGLNVVVARPAEGEAALPYAALADLAEPLLASVDSIPAAQRSALEAAVAGETVNSLVVSRGFLGLVRTAAAASTLVLALDDVQWLDPPSEAVLAFVVRRIADLPVRLLVARRSTGPQPAPLGLDRALGRLLETRAVGPLSLTELDHILRRRLGVRLARPGLVRLHHACGGNPLYALEIARSLEGAARDGEALPVPRELAAVLGARIQALPVAARDTALLASACLQPTVRMVELAAGTTSGLVEAIAQDLLEVERDRLRFTHPLLAAATYATAAPWERRDAHARLANVAQSTLERAHHLARSAEEPDENVASELERAAAEAAARGVPDTAAALAESAAGLSPDPSAGRVRAVAAAEYRLVAGDPGGAEASLRGIAEDLPAGHERARVLVRIADLCGPEKPDQALELAGRALEEAADNPALGAEIHLGIATVNWNLGRLGAATEHIRAAAALAEESDDDALVAMSLGELLHCEMILGLPFREDAAKRALSLERSLDHLPSASYFRPSLELATVYTSIDRPDDARPLLVAELARIDAAGDEAIRWGVLTRLSDLELRVGNLGEATRLAREALEAVRMLDHPGIERYALVPHAAALAHVGELDRAREVASEALAQSDRASSRLTALRALGTLGLVALSEDRPDEAWDSLAAAVDELDAIGVGELSIFGAAQNAVEALVALGRLNEAERIAGWVEAKGRPARRSWHEAVAARGHALVAAARGDFDAAQSFVTEALAAHERLPQPFELGRTLLAQGTIERRAKLRGPARASLTRALELFDTLGAARWAEKAAAELARIPGRSRGSGELTETERRVAELVAEGLSNKEVAAKLFVAVRTVEANLSKVYAKLGVRSRTELAGRLGPR